MPRIASQCIGDIRLIEQGTDILATALNRTPEDQEWLRQMRDVLHAILSANPDRWSFWLRWWDGVLSGRQIDWELQEQVALIPNDVWAAGPDAVAAAIAAIEDSAKSENDLPNTMSRSLERNRKAVLLQFDSLLAFVSAEIDSLRGQNSFTSSELDRRDRCIAALKQVVEALGLMREAIEGEPAESTALAVVQAQLPVVIEAADEVAKQGGTPEVSEVIATMAITIRHLTAAGTPGTIATGLAFADLCWRKIRGWRTKS